MDVQASHSRPPRNRRPDHRPHRRNFLPRTDFRRRRKPVRRSRRQARLRGPTSAPKRRRPKPPRSPHRNLRPHLQRRRRRRDGRRRR